LFTTLHCPTALVVKTNEQPLAARQMALLEEGASVIEWIAIVRPSSKNRALAAGTRRLVATARTRYIGFGTVKTEPIYHPSQQQPSINSIAPTSVQSMQGWDNNFTQLQGQTITSQHVELATPQQQQRPDISPSNSINNGFDWSAFPMFQNSANQQQQQQQPQATTQMLPVGQLSPLPSPNQVMAQGQPDTTFGHLPMMPNQMDIWPMSMQNLDYGQLGMTPAPDPYAPSSEGFDMWLASILADGGDSGQGDSGRGGGY
jgi:hypothetical protein